MGKAVVGKTYKVKQTPTGKMSSNGPGTRRGDDVIGITVTRESHNGSMLQGRLDKVSNEMFQMGYVPGNVYNYYEYELEFGPYNKEVILTEIEEVNKKKSELDKEVSELQSKIDWMETVGVSEFDENEYKVWKTLTLLEDDSVSKLEKMKEIANLIKG
jgi:hypothetical protein